MTLIVKTPGLVLTEHEFDIPLDHARPDGETITVFAREVADPDGLERPFLVFFQGGPGSEAPRPTRHPSSSGWLDRALKDYRVLMLDQRGTGRSTPIGDLSGKTPEQQAEYLTHFRADSIVRDAEWIRTALGVERWSILGQSFGGFCALNYLSQSPEGLAAAFITGGVPPLGLHPDEIYRATYARMLERNRRYYERYPADRERVRTLHEQLQADDVRLPNGDRLTSRRFRQVGNWLGMSDGAEHLHYLLERPMDSPGFRHDVQDALPFARNPIYAILHEACYADGHTTDWSAERVQPDEYAADVTLFTGEHVFSWMFDDYGALTPLQAAADILAKTPWPALYNPERLAHNEVPVAAAIYADDVYVESGLSLQTARLVRGMRPWLTNEYEHNGLRAAGDRILGRLIDLAHGRA
ncbi:MAG TPA: alpha/beta fold hydrolase [Kineosporiaceae bacterium]|nr:alpha/beta fold hydrolase [Kineosporiaceae bacterium]